MRWRSLAVNSRVCPAHIRCPPSSAPCRRCCCRGSPELPAPSCPGCRGQLCPWCHRPCGAVWAAPGCCERVWALGRGTSVTVVLMRKLSGLNTQLLRFYTVLSGPFCPNHDIQLHWRHPSIFYLRSNPIEGLSARHLGTFSGRLSYNKMSGNHRASQARTAEAWSAPSCSGGLVPLFFRGTNTY